MPTYEYVCTQCGQHVEVVQSFSDAPLTTCDLCGGALRKVFGNIGIVLKGSGFYKNDSRDQGKKKAAPAADAGAASPASGTSDAAGAPAATPSGTAAANGSGGATGDGSGSGAAATRTTGGSPTPAASGSS